MSKTSNIKKIETLKIWIESLKRLPGYKKPKPKINRWDKEVGDEPEYLIRDITKTKF